jgi:hypothetical protein
MITILSFIFLSNKPNIVHMSYTLFPIYIFEMIIGIKNFKNYILNF